MKHSQDKSSLPPRLMHQEMSIDAGCAILGRASTLDGSV